MSHRNAEKIHTFPNKNDCKTKKLKMDMMVKTKKLKMNTIGRPKKLKMDMIVTLKKLKMDIRISGSPACLQIPITCPKTQSHAQQD